MSWRSRERVPKIQDMTTVAAQPCRVPRRNRRVEEDVIVEGVATEAEEDLIPPAPVGGRRKVKDDGNQGPDVLDPSGLEVELGDHRIGRVGPRACHS